MFRKGVLTRGFFWQQMRVKRPFFWLLRASAPEPHGGERDIGEEKGAIDAARTGLRELESKKKLLETEIGSAEQTLAKYRTQQLSLKKNEEYQAMGHEIETVQGQISEMEGRELEIMFSIDVARKKFADAEAVLKQNISGHEARIKML